MTDVLIKQKGNWPRYEEDDMGRYRKIIYAVKKQEGLEQVHPPPSEGGVTDTWLEFSLQDWDKVSTNKPLSLWYHKL